MGDTSGVELDIASRQEPPVVPSPSASPVAIGYRQVVLECDLTHSVDNTKSKAASSAFSRPQTAPFSLSHRTHTG